MKRLDDILGTVLLAFCYAIPLAFLAFFTKQAGWNGFIVMFVPLFCAWHVGTMTALGKWERKMDADIARLKEKAGPDVDKQDEDD